MCVCALVQSDVMCLGSTPDTFEVEISANSDIVASIGQCSFSNSSNTSCGKFSSYYDGGYLILSLNLSEYLKLNEHYMANIGVHNIAGSANTFIEICEWPLLFIIVFMIVKSGLSSEC